MTTTGPTAPTSLEKLQAAVAQDIAIETQAVTLLLEVPGLIKAAQGSTDPDAALDALTASLTTAGQNLQNAIGTSGEVLTIVTTAYPDATVGAAYTASTTLTGGEAPETVSLTGLPAGLSADTGGNITGPVTAAPGSYTVGISAADAGGQTASGSATINVVAAAA